jgi:hypothetical protein
MGTRAPSAHDDAPVLSVGRDNARGHFGHQRSEQRGENVAAPSLLFPCAHPMFEIDEVMAYTEIIRPGARKF